MSITFYTVSLEKYLNNLMKTDKYLKGSSLFIITNYKRIPISKLYEYTIMI